MSAYLPTFPQLSRDVLSLLIATLAVAWLISEVPAFKTLVRSNSLTGV